MDSREQNGLKIAALYRIIRKGEAFFVPSQSDKNRFKVVPHPTKPHCNCPDHETTGQRCKHIWAVHFVMQRELFDYKEEVPEPVLPAKAPRKTYSQDWSAYNKAQTNEKDKFLDLLRDLCQGISEPHRAKIGRPQLLASRSIWRQGLRQLQELRRHRRPRGYAVHSFQGEDSHRQGRWPMGQNVPLLPISPRRILAPLSQA